MTTMELQRWREQEQLCPASPAAFDLWKAGTEIALAERELKEGKGIDECEMDLFFKAWKNRIAG